VVTLQTTITEDVGGIGKRCEFSLVQLVVLLRFLAVPHSLCTCWMIAVVVILMHGKDILRRVDYGNFYRKGIPKQPVIPARPANHKFRNLLVIQALGK
jgi:uncharacterized membrane protein YccF (DUF307 family)